MTIDKLLCSELAYIGPKALVAIKNTICDRFGHEAFEDEEGHPHVGEEVIADLLITLAAATRLRIAVATQGGSKPNNEYIVREEVFTSIGSVCLAKREELIEKLCGPAWIYATVNKGDGDDAGGSGSACQHRDNSFIPTPPAVGTTQSSDPQAIEDARLLEKYPNGVVPPWNCALCKEMLSESYGPGKPGYRVRIEDVTVSASGSLWFAFDGYQGGAYELYKWVAGGDADDEHSHYLQVAEVWRDNLIRRVNEAVARKSADAKNEGGASNE